MGNVKRDSDIRAPRAHMDAHFNQQKFKNAMRFRYVNCGKMLPKSKYAMVKVQKGLPSKKRHFS